MSAGERIEQRLRAAEAAGRTALLPYLVAGFPARADFAELLVRVAARAEVVELGLPFSDPTADGPVIAAAAQTALKNGVNLAFVCELARSVAPRITAGLVLMSYLNPLLARGLAPSLDALAGAGFEGLIVPDLPFDESDELRTLAEQRGLALIQLVTPLTPPARLAAIARASRGFLYAVTRTGTTGAAAEPAALAGYLERVRAVAPVPVCAGFGLRAPEHVRALAGHCAGAVVGSALVELLARGEDPVPLLDSLRDAAHAAGAKR